MVFRRRRKDADAPGPVAGSAVGQAAAGVAPSWPPSRVEDLGIVTASARDLVLIDFGLLRLWSGESAPRLDPDDVGEDVAETANSAVDFVIVGDDPVAAGRAVDLAAVAGRHVFDIPAAKVDDSAPS